MSERKWLRVVELDVVKQAPGHTMVCVLNSANFTVGTPFFVPDGYALDAPDDEQLRRERDAWKRCAKSWEDCSKELEKERGEFRDRVAELEAQVRSHEQLNGDLTHMIDKAEEEHTQAERQRDEARREAEELRQERYRLRHELEEAESIAANQPVFAGDIIGKQSVKSLVSRGIVRKNRDGDYVLRTTAPECSAPHQTHCVPVRVTSQLTNTPGPWEKLVEVQLPYSAGQTKATIPADMLLSPSHGYDAQEVEDWRRDAAETARLRAENERLRESTVSACPECGSSLCFDPRYGQLRWADPSDDQPAPQTHYMPGDVVLPLDDREYRLVELHGVFQGEETWLADDGEELQIEPGAVRILERDGIPTDEGLRRLAERAGYSFVFRGESACAVEGMSIDRGIPHSRGPQATLYGHDPKWRKRLAAALREMGGA